MNIIVIDDQTSVVNGIIRGIDWKAIGVEKIFKAFNAFEAKAVFSQNHIDVMLCDIEMPVENGISLLRWVRNQGYETECIFLTAHAEFEYAKEALSLGSMDYIVSPAPYDEIRAVVERAIAKVREKNKKAMTYTYGMYMQSKSRILCERILEDWLKGSIDQAQYVAFYRVENVPGLSYRGYPVILSLLRQKSLVDQWEPSLIKFTFQNIIEEIFAPFGQNVIVVDLDWAQWGIVIYEKNGYLIDYPGLLRQMDAVIQTLLKYLKCETAAYTWEQAEFLDMPGKLKSLSDEVRQNVSAKCGVYELSMPVLAEKELNQKQLIFLMKRCKKYILDDLYDTAATELYHMLDEMAAQDLLNADHLLRFHMEFNKMIYFVFEQKEMDIQLFTQSDETIRRYKDAEKSLDAMKSYIVYTMTYFKTQVYDEYEQQSQLEQIEKYIAEHIGTAIHRDEIADYVHLNVDYMGRLFKKNRGISLKEYIIEQKMRMAQNLLRTTVLPISFVASKVGYSNFSYFSRIYKKVIGVSPTDERKK